MRASVDSPFAHRHDAGVVARSGAPAVATTAESIVAAIAGRIDVIATPIGNLGDLSPRARDALAAADLVAAEDTRRTAQLLTSLGLSRPIVSLHEHNEAVRVEELLARLAAGAVIALVSDAGTPLLSDPGFELVRAARAAGHEVRSIPGPSAITAALSVAGIATARFAFEGFLPARSRERRERLGQLAHESRTLVFFEAPHRIVECLDDLTATFGATREAAIGRELTKAFETLYHDSLGALAQRAHEDPNIARGEITLIVAGAPEGTASVVPAAELERVVALLARELPPSKAAALAAQITGARRSEAYEIAVRLASRARVASSDG
jgi:16S rRNA (cytidine1402-2'-O)-methyltransferase